MSVNLESTTVRRWSTCPVVDPTATRLVVVNLDGRSTHLGISTPGIPVSTILGAGFCPEVAAQLHDIVASCVVGTRLHVSGAEADVLAVLRWARAAGFEDEEVTCAVTDGSGLELQSDRRVVCAHCHAVTTARFRVGDTVVCASCSSPIVVYHHVSLLAGGYLGFRPDAEDRP